MRPPQELPATGGHLGQKQPNLVALGKQRSSRSLKLLHLLGILLTTMICLASRSGCSYLVWADDGPCLRKSSMPCPAPRKFNDTFLPATPPESAKEFEHMGRISLLDKAFVEYLWFSATDHVVTSFNLYNRRKIMRRIVYQPNTYSTLVRFGEKVGPYEYNVDHLVQSAFKVSSKTVIMIPGYLSTEDEAWITTAREAWLDLEDVNVIEVSWTFSNKALYQLVVARTPVVARQVVMLLHYLAELSQTTLHDEQFLMNIHLIGHSLGAQIAGFVGRDLAGKVGRITGLDPAGPAFDCFSRDKRLDKKSAKLVEVMFTNRGRMRYVKAGAGIVGHMLDKVGILHSLSQSILQSYQSTGKVAYYGIEHHLGHINYYANDGKNQPGCDDPSGICSHGRATEIYVDMLLRERFIRKWTADEKLLKERRFLAFPADDYQQFMVGVNFIERCPLLIDKEAHLTPTVGSQFKKCSIPIDLITPTEELIKELRDDYNIDFDTPDISPQKYYFRTQYEERDLIGDHYLLKIYSDRLFFDEFCSIAIEMQFPSETRTRVIDVDGLSDHSGVYSGVATYAVPFVYSDNSTLRRELHELWTDLDANPDSDVDHNRMRRLLPSHVTIALKREKPEGFFDSFTQIFSRAPLNCDTSIDVIEIHPVRSHGRNFAGIYRSSEELPNYVLTGSTRFVKYLDERSLKDHQDIGTITYKEEPRTIYLKGLVVS